MNTRQRSPARPGKVTALHTENRNNRFPEPEENSRPEWGGQQRINTMTTNIKSALWIMGVMAI